MGYIVFSNYFVFGMELNSNMRDKCQRGWIIAGWQDWLTHVSESQISVSRTGWQGQKASLLMRRTQKGDKNPQSPGENKEVTHRQQQSWDAPEVLCGRPIYRAIWDIMSHWLYCESRECKSSLRHSHFETADLVYSQWLLLIGSTPLMINIIYAHDI